jgi:hypothetical protein
MKMKVKNAIITLLVIMQFQSSVVLGSTAQTRMDTDIAHGKPIVVQVSVALADNKHQWIVPVPPAIGNGQDARTNLYWGARYGIKTYMIKDGGWEIVTATSPPDKRILERIVLKHNFSRNGRVVPVYLVAEAWDGKFIKDTIKQFLNYTAGKDAFEIQLEKMTFFAGGNAHLVAYIGHNALMDGTSADISVIPTPDTEPDKQDNDAIVLACKSKPYFLSHLEKLGAHPLLLTTGLMAPEAYSLHAAIQRWVEGGNDLQVKKAAAESYNRYQKTGQRAAERLFGIK